MTQIQLTKTRYSFVLKEAEAEPEKRRKMRKNLSMTKSEIDI